MDGDVMDRVIETPGTYCELLLSLFQVHVTAKALEQNKTKAHISITASKWFVWSTGQVTVMLQEHLQYDSIQSYGCALMTSVSMAAALETGIVQTGMCACNLMVMHATGLEDCTARMPLLSHHVQR